MSGLSGGRGPALRCAPSDPTAEKRSNKDCGAPWLAENVEPSGLTKGNSFQQNRFRTQCRYGSIWTTLNGHEARNRGHCQEIAPTSNPQTCQMRWDGYGRHSVCASTPEVGAQCGSSARWDLRGGRRVTGVPTATAQRSRLSDSGQALMSSLGRRRLYHCDCALAMDLETI